MRKNKNSKLRQNKTAKHNKKRRELRKLLKKKEAAALGRQNLIYQLYQTIIHFFPDLFDRMRQIEDHRKKGEYELAALITACIAMFVLKEGSRNAFNNDRKEGKFAKNYKKIFKMPLPHMDTVDNVMRELKEDELEELKKHMVRNLLEKKTLHKYRFLNQWFIVAIDGTGVMTFAEKHCDNCLHQTSEKGKTTYSHKVLEAKLVCGNGFSISLATEWIENPDGEYDKQDCEQNAFKRLEKKLKSYYPRLPICITVDGLYPNEPFFEICQKNDWRFIVTFEDGNLPSVWKTIERLKPFITVDQEISETNIEEGKTISRIYRWINGIDYRGYELSWIEYEKVTENPTEKTKKVSHFVYLTDIEISQKNAKEVVFSGRLRWKIENEGFNTQKNLGYELKHKYSRVSYRALKNYYQCLQIGHIINQLLELSLRFRESLKGKTTIKHLWKCMLALLTFGDIDEEIVGALEQVRGQYRFV